MMANTRGSEWPRQPRPLRVSTISLNNRILALRTLQLESLDLFAILIGEANRLSVKTIKKPRNRKNSSCITGPGGSALPQQIDSELDEKNCSSLRVFENCAVHGIEVLDHSTFDIGDKVQLESTKSLLCVFGDHSLRLISCEYTAHSRDDFYPDGKVCLRPVADEKILSELIITVSFLTNGRVAAVVAQNAVVILSAKSLDFLQTVECMDHSILYTAKIINTTFKDEFIVIGGTAFGFITAWIPREKEGSLTVPVYQSQHHDGAIFSIDFCPKRRLLCSTSDDRSCKVYTVEVTDNTWKSVRFQVVVAVFGHEARVWRAKILQSGYFITVGEDTRCCVWDTKGNLAHSWNVHTGINIWSLDIIEQDDQSVIVTGGADGSVVVTHLNTKPASDFSAPEVKSLPYVEERRIRHFAIWDQSHFLVLLDTGRLYLVSTENNWELLWESPDLLQCVAITPHPPLECFALVTCYGKISFSQMFDRSEWLWDLQSNCMQSVCTTDGNMHIMVVSGPCGKMWIFRIACGSDGCSMSLLGEVLLSSKNSWITALGLQENMIICGDRGGSLHGIRITGGNIGKVFTLPYVHGHSEVSQITFISTSRVYTCGRSGQITCWNLLTDDLEKCTLEPLKSYQVSKRLVEWICGFSSQFDGNRCQEMVAFGFRSSKFLAVDMLKGRIVVEAECGGGNRFSTIVSFSNSKNVRFGFIRLNHIKWIDFYPFTLEERFLCLKQPLSSSQIWDVDCLGIERETDGNEYLVYAIAQEDTFVSVIRILMADAGLPVSPEIVAVCKGHLSSARAVTWSSNLNCFYSGGGRNQLICWSVMEGNLSGNVVKSSEYTPFPVVRKRWSERAELDPDARIMNIHSCAVGNYDLIAAGGSDGQVKVFSNVNNRALHLCGTVGPLRNCILRVRLLALDGTVVLFACLTSGRISIFDLNVCTRSLEDPFVINEMDQIGTFTCHQSGVDAVDVGWSENGCHMIASGADDGSVCVVRFRGRDVSAIPSNVEPFVKETAHAAQITGIQLLEAGSKVLTASKDQTIKLWAVHYEDAAIENLGVVYTTVADISHIHCHPVTNFTQSIFPRKMAIIDGVDDQSDEADYQVYYVAVVGAGFELLKLCI